MFTNPDAIKFEHGITVRCGTRDLDIVPLFQTGKQSGNQDVPPTFASAIGIRLLQVVPSGEGWIAARNRRGDPVLLRPDATDYKTRVGENTHYYMHPEEVTAMHFQWLIHQAAGEEPTHPLPRPEKLDELAATLRKVAGSCGEQLARAGNG
jgi:hypothetical protein